MKVQSFVVNPKEMVSVSVVMLHALVTSPVLHIVSLVMITVSSVSLNSVIK